MQSWHHPWQSLATDSTVQDIAPPGYERVANTAFHIQFIPLAVTLFLNHVYYITVVKRHDESWQNVTNFIAYKKVCS